MSARLGARRAVVLASTAGAVLASMGGTAHPLRTALVFWFVAVVPGLALSHHVGDAEPAIRLVLIVAISLALAAIVSEALAIAKMWSPVTLMAVLAAVSLVGCLPVRRVE